MTSTTSGARPASSALDGPGGLLESLALGTGFDIALVQYGLLPPAEADLPAGVEPEAGALAADTAQSMLEPTPVGEAAPPVDPALQLPDAIDPTWLLLAAGG